MPRLRSWALVWVVLGCLSAFASSEFPRSAGKYDWTITIAGNRIGLSSDSGKNTVISYGSSSATIGLPFIVAAGVMLGLPIALAFYVAFSAAKARAGI
ncbi:MAG TPA: hypothetical protein DCR55_08465 [Lentisphaeria bacterium]|nr:hypothetical protein [Lentisphaeria bacterium]